MSQRLEFRLSTSVVCVSKKSLRPLFSSNEEREKSVQPSSGCSSIQRYERSESIMSIVFFLRHKKTNALYSILNEGRKNARPILILVTETD